MENCEAVSCSMQLTDYKGIESRPMASSQGHESRLPVVMASQLSLCIDLDVVVKTNQSAVMAFGLALSEFLVSSSNSERYFCVVSTE